MKLIYFQELKKSLNLKKVKCIIYFLNTSNFKYILIAYILHLYTDMHSLQTTANVDICKESEQSIANF